MQRVAFVLFLVPLLSHPGLRCVADQWQETDTFAVDPWNKELIEHLVDDFEIVHPIQLRDRSRVGIDTRNYLFDNVTVHFEQCSFVLKTSYGRLRLHVQLNDVLIPIGAKYRRFLHLDSVAETSGHSLANCYYQGQVHGHGDSQVALSTCFGLRGSIVLENNTFLIVPMKGGNLTRRHPHLFMRMRRDEEATCGNTDSTEWSRRGISRKRPLFRRLRKRDIDIETKFVELSIFVEQRLVNWLNLPSVELFRFLLECVNIVDLMFQQLNVRVSLVHAELWVSTNRISVQREIVPSLLNFVQFLSRESDTLSHDAALLVSTAELNKAETMSVSDTVCTRRAAGMVKMADKFQPFYTSVLMAHSIGHILGMSHDDGDLECDDADAFINIMGGLYSFTPSKRSRKIYRFTECSRKDFLALLNSAEDRCLFNQPLQDNGLAKCGNKVIDEGELCDCGSVDECESVDPCCDAVTCKLKAGAQCASGPCCDKCKFVSNETICRPSQDAECDLPEHCAAISGKCPADSYKIDGSPCGSDQQGYCYAGRCSRAANDCQKIWGPESTVADEACFRKFNTLGIDFGHCGVDYLGRPIACADRDYLCGLLFCKGGTESPSFPFYFKTQFTEDGNVFECKAFIDDKSPVNSSLVRNGAKCGTNKLCKAQSCIHLDQVQQNVDCPTNNVALHCSGHGTCTNLNTCYCDVGWSSIDCSFKLNISHAAVVPSVGTDQHGSALPIPSSSPDHHPSDSSSRLDTYAMLIILGCVAVGIFLMLLLLLLCYRRRTNFSKAKMVGVTRAEYERDSNSSTETANRSIRFGPSRTYRCDVTPTSFGKRPLDQAKEKDGDDEPSIRNKEAVAELLLQTGDDCSNYYVDRPAKWSCAKLPSKGILKNGPYSFSSHHSRSLLQRGCDGYESEPAYPVAEGLKVAPRQCWLQVDTANGRTSINREGCLQVAKGAYESVDGKQTICRSRLNHTAAAIVSPYLYIRNQSLANNSPSASSIEPKVVVCQKGAVHSEGLDPAMSCRHHHFASPLLSPSRTAHDGSPDRSQVFRSSPANSTCSTSRLMLKPKPLKLTNIEFLLKQLEHKSANENGKPIASTSPGSSAELSLPDDDNQPVDENCFISIGDSNEADKQDNCNGRVSQERSGSLGRVNNRLYTMSE
uniref:Disintegrin domain-containing protein n=1 Tax=Trichuris muris TaxID=70415 RepID=A0A5S6QUA5_TRIMR